MVLLHDGCRRSFPIWYALHFCWLTRLTHEDTIAGYVYVGINAGVYDPGFSLDASNKLHWDGNDFLTFAICPGTVPPYESQGVQAQVFWRGEGSSTDENCTDIEFVAVPTTVEA